MCDRDHAIPRLADLHIEASGRLAAVQAQHRILSAENLELRRRLALDLAFDRAAKAVTGQGAAQPGAEIEDQTRRYATAAAPDDLFDDSGDPAASDTLVIDVEDLCGPGGPS